MTSTRVRTSVPPRALAVALLAAVVAALAAPTPPPAAAGPCPGAYSVPTERTLSRARRATLCLVNVQRRRNGVRPLRSNGRLTRAAQAHARDMVRRKYFSHYSPGGRGFTERIRATGYLAGARSWVVAENIAWGGRRWATPAGIVRIWMRSAEHRRNMLNGRYREGGMGIAPGLPVRRRVRGATYTATFGARRG